MYDIIIGRSPKDTEKLGTTGTILLGKHYITMGRTTSLSNSIYLDVVSSHVVLICGKRGGGKSYTMGVIAEGMASLPKEISQNLAVIMLDTMGVYWTMKYPNHKDELLLKNWGMEGKGLDVKIYTPTKYYHEYKEKGIPTDFPFSIKPSELTGSEWAETFEINQNEPMGVLIERLITELREQSDDFSIDDIINTAEESEGFDQNVKDAVKNRFLTAKQWGVFDSQGTPLADIAKGGQVTVLDVSCYATLENGWKIKSLVVGLVSQKLFNERMNARKMEEYSEIHHAEHYFGDSDDSEKAQKEPLVWLVIDEAHEFLPFKGKTTASFPLTTILREGRQPGISLILATQQPGKISTDVMTQSDTVISHRITAKVDVEALGMLMQSYMREGLTQVLDGLPRVKGVAVVFDDTNEKMYPMRVRPRTTWHGGGSPSAIHAKKKTFEF